VLLSEGYLDRVYTRFLKPTRVCIPMSNSNMVQPFLHSLTTCPTHRPCYIMCSIGSSQQALSMHCVLILYNITLIYLRHLSHWKLISKFMLIYSFRKKISSVNSQLSKETNFKIVFCNLEHVLFCGNFTVIGQSAVFTNIDMNRRRCWLSKVYFQCELIVLTFKRKIWKFLF